MIMMINDDDDDDAKDPTSAHAGAAQRRTIEELLVGPEAAGLKTLRPEFLRLVPPLFLRDDEMIWQVGTLVMFNEASTIHIHNRRLLLRLPFDISQSLTEKAATSAGICLHLSLFTQDKCFHWRHQ